MNINNSGTASVMAFASATGKVGFVVFNHKGLLVDWGVIDTSGNNIHMVATRFDKLSTTYHPQLCVLEDLDDPEWPKGLLSRRSVSLLIKQAEGSSLRTAFVNRSRLKECLYSETVTNKHAVAQIIAKLYPELQQHLPPKRKIWEPESRWMVVFEAMSLVLARVHT